MHFPHFTVRQRILVPFGICIACALLVGILPAMTFLNDLQLSSRTALQIELALSAVLLTASIAGAVTLMKSVYGGRLRMRVKFTELADSLDFSRRAARRSDDEFGRAAAEFDRTLGRFETTVSTVRRASRDISLATSEIASGNQDISARTAEQAMSLEETASNMRQLNNALHQNAQRTKQANELATKAVQVAERGHASPVRLFETIAEVSGNPRKIADINGLIEGVAFQANLLALNASVEAARAGEADRGFSVVANEVRALAQRATDAAREIRELIATSEQSVLQGQDEALVVRQAVDDMRMSINRMSEVIYDISLASNEQSESLDEVSDSVLKMDKTTQQNAALVEQIAAASVALRDQAEQLKAAVVEFKISECETVW